MTLRPDRQLFVAIVVAVCPYLLNYYSVLVDLMSASDCSMDVAASEGSVGLQ